MIKALSKCSLLFDFTLHTLVFLTSSNMLWMPGHFPVNSLGYHSNCICHLFYQLTRNSTFTTSMYDIVINILILVVTHGLTLKLFFLS